MSKHYSEVEVSKWNTAHFQAYLCDKHLEDYGVHYVSSGGLLAERKLLSKYIGKRGTPGIYPKETVKRFIDACFAKYKPNPQYPGLSAWFMFTYMTSELQRLEAQQYSASAQTNAESGDVDWI